MFDDLSYWDAGSAALWAAFRFAFTGTIAMDTERPHWTDVVWSLGFVGFYIYNRGRFPCLDHTIGQFLHLFK